MPERFRMPRHGKPIRWAICMWDYGKIVALLYEDKDGTLWIGDRDKNGLC